MKRMRGIACWGWGVSPDSHLQKASGLTPLPQEPALRR
jgi:hypothetical protein